MTVLDNPLRRRAAIRSDGLRIVYDVEGDGAPPLLLIGGFNADRPFWELVRPLLAGFTTIAFDNRDVGESDLAPGDYTVADMARDALAVLDDAGIGRAHVLGHSMGGAIAQELALAAPERVDRLVLANTLARPDTYAREVMPLLQDLRRALDDRTFYLILHVFGLGREMLRTVPLSAVVDEILAAGPVQDAGGAIRQLAACRRIDTLERIGDIAAPTLVIHAPDDALLPPACGDEIAAAIPGAARATLGSGHCPMVEVPEAFAAAVRAFLAA